MVSGADVVPAAVVTDRQAHTKFACWSVLMMPSGTFMDPANTATAPSDVLVDASLDALSHALEGLTSLKTTPIAQNLALEAAGRIFRALPVLARDSRDAAAREDLCLGCLEAAMVVGNTRAAAIHGLSYPVSSAFPISHGRSNAILAPAVIRFNGVVTKEEYKALAASMGLDAVGDAAEAIAGAITELNRSLGLPSGLAEIGVGVENIPSLVDSAERNRWFFDEVNPRPVSRSDMEALYAEALG
jgi:alcohol dehydrogenase class IV